MRGQNLSSNAITIGVETTTAINRIAPATMFLKKATTIAEIINTPASTPRKPPEGTNISSNTTATPSISKISDQISGSIGVERISLRSSEVVRPAQARKHTPHETN